MKARIINPNNLTMSPQEQRRKGVEIISNLRKEGFTDEQICKKMGIPVDMKDRFFEHLGLASK